MVDGRMCRRGRQVTKVEVRIGDGGDVEAAELKRVEQPMAVCRWRHVRDAMWGRICFRVAVAAGLLLQSVFTPRICRHSTVHIKQITTIMKFVPSFEHSLHDSGSGTSL